MATTAEPTAVAAPKTVTLTIEGRQVTVPEGTSILEAAKHAGVLIPHYCYHPGLPVAGVCRMCLVEVEKAPKLAPSCATAVADGQVVHVHSAKSRDAREGVLEMLLINHPLDCPICDQAGECELQDYTFQEGPKESRLKEPKRFNPAEDFGGDVLYVTNRCILCTRCVRFMDDVAHEPVLNVEERGDRAVIGIFPGKELTNVWAGNVVDLCPVGALLSKDFLNKARAWEIDRAPSICANCSQGCNVMLETRDEAVVRMQPRPNDAVNQYFMCDVGRLGYRWLNRPDRATLPMVNLSGALAPTDWDTAVAAAARALAGKRVFVAASPNLSNESLYLLAELMRGGAGTVTIPRGDEVPLPGVEDLALRADRAANGRGAELLGFRRGAAPLDGLNDGDALVVADCDLEGAAAADIARAGSVIVIGTTLPAVARAPSAVLPPPNYAEDEGTLTNLRGGRVFLPRPPAAARRADRVGSAPDRQLRGGRGNVHQLARPRAAVHAGEDAARHGSPDVVGRRRPALGDRPADRLLHSGRGLRGARERAAGIRRHELRFHWPPRGPGRRGGVRTMMLPTYPLLQVADPQQPMPSGVAWFLFTVLKLLALFTFYMVTVAYLTLAERKVSAWIQGRLGPNRVGPGGLLQPLADGVKNFMKEEAETGDATQPLFSMAPALAFIPALTVWSVIPWASPAPTRWGRLDFIVADAPIGFLFILAIASLGVYGIVLAGWASNNKYSLLGGLRSSAQMVSYEVALGMSTIPVILLAGNVTLSEIVRQQAHSMWNVVNLTIAFIIFIVSAFAETNRVPFDLPEAESELVAGYHTEYSAMKFSLFFIAEYANVLTSSALMATLFFGGWDIPFTGWDNAAPFTWLKTVLTLGCFLTKVFFFVFVFIWVRWTLPRFRYDQLMSLGWRVMLPLALGYIALIATTELALAAIGVAPGPLHSFVLLMENVCVVLLLFVMVDEGRLISPAYGRAQQEELLRMRARAFPRALPGGGGK